MNDFAKKLRGPSTVSDDFPAIYLNTEDARLAADYLEKMEIENARLRSALSLYSCEDGCNDCPEHERDRVGCGWTAYAALRESTQ